MKIHLVDGTHELFRNHFGAPPKTAPDGRQVGATLGLMRSLLMLLNSPGVTHVACAFDHTIESFRNKLYAGYKTSAGVHFSSPGHIAQSILPQRRTRPCHGHTARHSSPISLVAQAPVARAGLGPCYNGVVDEPWSTSGSVGPLDGIYRRRRAYHHLDRG